MLTWWRELNHFLYALGYANTSKSGKRLVHAFFCLVPKWQERNNNLKTIQLWKSHVCFYCLYFRCWYQAITLWHNRLRLPWILVGRRWATLEPTRWTLQLPWPPFRHRRGMWLKRRPQLPYIWTGSGMADCNVLFLVKDWCTNPWRIQMLVL